MRQVCHQLPARWGKDAAPGEGRWPDCSARAETCWTRLPTHYPGFAGAGRAFQKTVRHNLSGHTQIVEMSQRMNLGLPRFPPCHVKSDPASRSSETLLRDRQHSALLLRSSSECAACVLQLLRESLPEQNPETPFGGALQCQIHPDQLYLPTPFSPGVRRAPVSHRLAVLEQQQNYQFLLPFHLPLPDERRSVGIACPVSSHPTPPARTLSVPARRVSGAP